MYVCLCATCPNWCLTPSTYHSDWIRNNDVSPDDETFVARFSKNGLVPVAGRTPEQRKKDSEAALNWLRNKGVDDDLLDSTGDFRRLDDALPKKSGQSLEDRAQGIESALDWCRTKGVATCSEEPLPSFDRIGSLPVARRSPEERANHLKNVLNWLRNKGKRDEELDPTGEFRKMDSSIPPKRGQSNEDRAREIEGAM
jgi:hypothetical protein